MSGDYTELVGTYRGPARGSEMVVTVTATPQGPMFSTNGAPARALSWRTGLQFVQGGTTYTFRRANGDSGPIVELRVQGGSALYPLKKQ